MRCALVGRVVSDCRDVRATRLGCTAIGRAGTSMAGVTTVGATRSVVMMVRALGAGAGAVAVLPYVRTRWGGVSRNTAEGGRTEHRC